MLDRTRNAVAPKMGAHAAVDGKRTVDIDDQARQFAPDGVDVKNAKPDAWVRAIKRRSTRNYPVIHIGT